MKKPSIPASASCSRRDCLEIDAPWEREAVAICPDPFALHPRAPRSYARRRQVSWLTAPLLDPAFPEQVQWLSGRTRRSQLRGQPRLRTKRSSPRSLLAPSREPPTEAVIDEFAV